MMPNACQTDCLSREGADWRTKLEAGMKLPAGAGWLYGSITQHSFTRSAGEAGRRRRAGEEAVRRQGVCRWQHETLV
ncbi:hypothetical protein KCP76_08825 [Salmonella enterica subsp. enterica serovar Weltevreden]|nr:hypothetical protein KCP76_08825 [Salmonella enterica subsp. enterica serovar Weltevreden]